MFPENGEVSAMTLCLLREAVAIESPEAETAVALRGLGAYPILQSRQPEVVDRWIREVRSGESIAPSR